MDISIIIPTFNRSPILRKLLLQLTQDPESAAAYTYEIIVVDDRSVDDTVSMVKSEFPSVRLLLGAGKNAEVAKRLAVENAKGRYIVALDDDSMPAMGWLAAVKPALERGEKIVQGKIVWTDMGQISHENETSKKTFRTGFRFDMMPVTILHGGYRGQYINMAHEFGCFVERDVLRKVPLDDRNLMFHHLGESASFFLRAKKEGYKVYFEPKCVVEHLGSLAGGIKDRDAKSSTKTNCSDFTTGVVHNFMILARMYQPIRIPLLIPYYLAGATYLSIIQKKNCFKYFIRGMYRGLSKPWVSVEPYLNL